jgi:hypothetical protein
MLEDEVDDLLNLSWQNYQMEIRPLCTTSLQHPAGKLQQIFRPKVPSKAVPGLNCRTDPTAPVNIAVVVVF